MGTDRWFAFVSVSVSEDRRGHEEVVHVCIRYSLNASQEPLDNANWNPVIISNITLQIWSVRVCVRESERRRVVGSAIEKAPGTRRENPQLNVRPSRFLSELFEQY